MEVQRERGIGGPAVGRRPVDGIGLVAAGALMVAAVVVAEITYGGRSLGAEGPPATGAGYLVRSSVFALASIALVVGARRLVTTALAPGPTRPPPDPVELAVIAIGAGPAIAAAGLVLVDPSALSSLVREDGPVEWASAGLAFVAAGLYTAAAAVHLRRRAGPISIVTVLALVAAAGAAALLALEEISWFQRVLDVESPEFMINRNGQQELNLHNLATSATGNAYFVGGFLFCCALPSLLADRAPTDRLAPLWPLVPSRTVLLATATSAAVVYEMWNIAWIQLTFWATLAILGTVGPQDTSRRVARVLLVVSLVVAGIHLAAGDGMVRAWDDTEVRELIIPYGLALAAAETLARVGRRTSAP